MTENEKIDIKEIQTEEQPHRLKPDGIIPKKINGKTFVTEIYFDKKNKETFQDKLFKIVKDDERLESKKEIIVM